MQANQIQLFIFNIEDIIIFQFILWVERASVCRIYAIFIKVTVDASLELIIYFLSVIEMFPNQVNIPNASNACSGFGDSFGWTFFHLNAIHNEYKENPVTVLQADYVSCHPPF